MPGLSAQVLARGVAELNASLRGGPTAKIAAALMKLISATRRPAWMDDATATVYFGTLQEAMHEYPVDCVEDACAAWRRSDSGEWWPAEKELRRICDRLFEPRRKLKAEAERLLRSIEAEEQAQERARQPSQFAGSHHHDFREAMRDRFGPERFAAWFDSADILFSGDNLILCRIKGAPDVFERFGADIMRQYGVRVEWRPVSFRDIPSRKFVEPTPEEHAHTMERFKALMAALRSGADIGEMQRRGEL